MKTLISQFVLLCLLSMLLGIGVTYICENMRYCNAREYYENVIRQIEDGYFDQAVIRDCTTGAEQQGYQLSVHCYGEGQKDARVTLKYEYVLPVIQAKKQCVIDGYAR